VTTRIEKMLSTVGPEQKIPLCITQMKVAEKVMKANVRKDIITIRGAMQEGILDSMPLFICDGDLIAGEGASKPNGVEFNYEYGVYNREEVEAMMDGDHYSLDPEDEKELYRINDVLFGENGLVMTSSEFMIEHLSGDDFWPLMSSGVVLQPWRDKTTGPGGGYAQSGVGLGPGFYLHCVNYGDMIRRGARSYIDEAKQSIKELRYFERDCIEKKRYWNAVIRMFEAWIRWANRYADLAEDMAQKEADPIRAQELRDMAVRCRHVPEYPARDFREGIQFFWFIFMMCNPCPTASLGRFDQYMYPLYKADKEAGRITDEEVLELIENMRVKEMRIHTERGSTIRKRTAGLAKWHNMTLGGLNPDGSDATNELTYLVLKAVEEVRTPNFTVSVRIHKNTPDKLLLEALKVVRLGLGMPAFVGDSTYMKFFMDHGVSYEDASNYCLAGCIDGTIIVFGLLFTGLVELFPKTFVSIFSSDDTTVEMGTQFVKIGIIGVAGTVCINFFTASFQAFGKWKHSFFMNGVRQIAIYIPAIIIMGKLWGGVMAWLLHFLWLNFFHWQLALSYTYA